MQYTLNLPPEGGEGESKPTSASFGGWPSDWPRTRGQDARLTAQEGQETGEHACAK